jgi:hypothetical protein
MYRKKEFGKSRIDSCPFCNKQSTTTNSQGVPVCSFHKNTDLIANFKCVCNSWLDLKKGKYGVYFNCMNCGNLSFDKGLELNPDWKENFEKETGTKPIQKINSGGRVFIENGKTITEYKSDEVDFI